ncbi:MAG: 4-hydroxy-tetrahydrodipicolinate synthase [Gammaproteobacteria bacterium]|nr:4-hydroxy-tetrahydrodipicolinate synthase [Gammaproteobacteria bacterium]
MFKGSIPALVTPMRGDGAIDFEAWDRLIDFHLAEGSDAVVVGGTTGESPTLERNELEELVRRAKARVAGRIPVIAGSGTAGTAKSIALSRACEAAGADALLVVTPYYNRPTQEGLFQHFTAIADAVGIPLVLYNVPGRTACDMLPATIARLSRHPRIAAVKEATGDISRGAEVLKLSRKGFVLLSGDDATAAALMKVGSQGVISVTANVAARAMHEVCMAGLRGAHDEAAALDAPLTALHRTLFVEPNPIPVKWAVHRIKLVGPTLRLPLVPLSEANHAAVESAMRAAGVVAG